MLVNKKVAKCSIQLDGIGSKKTSIDLKVPKEAYSVDPLPLKANVTALSEKLVITSSSNIFSFFLHIDQRFISMASTSCHLHTTRANVNLPLCAFLKQRLRSHW